MDVRRTLVIFIFCLIAIRWLSSAIEGVQAPTTFSVVNGECWITLQIDRVTSVLTIKWLRVCSKVC